MNEILVLTCTAVSVAAFAIGRIMKDREWRAKAECFTPIKSGDEFFFVTNAKEVHDAKSTTARLIEEARQKRADK